MASGSCVLFKVSFVGPGILKAESLLHLLITCCAASSPCSCVKGEESLLLSSEWSQQRWKGGFTCASKGWFKLGSWVSTIEVSFQGAFFTSLPLSPLHSLKQGTQIPDFKKPWLCCRTAPAGAHCSLAGRLGRGSSHLGWEKSLSHSRDASLVFCPRRLWGSSVGGSDAPFVGFPSGPSVADGWYGSLQWDKWQELDTPCQTGHRQVFIRL